MYAKNALRVRKRQPLIRELTSAPGKSRRGYSHTFIVSLDRKNFYTARALNSRQALKIVMKIGANPPPNTPPPPVPGKKRPSRFESCYSVNAISKEDAVRLLKSDLIRKQLCNVQYNIKNKV